MPSVRSGQGSRSRGQSWSEVVGLWRVSAVKTIEPSNDALDESKMKCVTVRGGMSANDRLTARAADSCLDGTNVFSISISKVLLGRALQGRTRRVR